MAAQNNAKEPAQVPGDAESPPKGEEDRAVREGAERPDKTEPVQTSRTTSGGKNS